MLDRSLQELFLAAKASKERHFIDASRSGNPALFSESEQAALRLAYLSAQTPLVTPRRFVEPVMAHFDAQTCIELFVVCGMAELVRRFAVIIASPAEPAVAAFIAAHALPTDALALRFPPP